MKTRTALRMLPISALLAFTGLSGCSSDDNKSTNVVQTTEPFESGNLVAGGTFVHVFPTAGSFSYRCRFHGGMTGTISVTSGMSDSAVVAIGDNVFAAAAPIKPGGYVRWIYSTGVMTHSVTRP